MENPKLSLGGRPVVQLVLPAYHDDEIIMLTTRIGVRAAQSETACIQAEAHAPTTISGIADALRPTRASARTFGGSESTVPLSARDCLFFRGAGRMREVSASPAMCRKFNGQRFA